MGPEVVNRNKDSNFYGPYAGRDLYITMMEDKEREFVVTHNANIKPVSYFTGRETELQELRHRIEEKRKSVLVSGMGGIGKTHICRKLFEEYLKKHADGAGGLFRHIGYVEYSGDMGSSLQNCLKYKQQDKQEANREAAWRELEYLASDGKLLLFVDNVDRHMGEDQGLQRLKSIPSAVVLTSRQTSLSDEFEPYRIGSLSIEQCREIYEKVRFENSGRKIKSEEVQDLEYIIDKLAGRHTITVEFLAYLAWTKHWTARKLRGELEQKGFRLEFRKNGELINIQQTYEVLYDLSGLTEAEQNILEAFSVFPSIPLEAEICNQWLLADAGVGEDDDILTGLYQKGWLQFDLEQESYAMHPVFAQFIYDKCKPKTESHEVLIKTSEESLDISNIGSALVCQRFIPFGENIVEKFELGKELEHDDFILTLSRLLEYIGQYKEAEKLYSVLMETYRMRLGEEHPLTALIYNNLAMVHYNQGEYGKAEELIKKSLEIYEKELEQDHSDIARSYNNLALVYYSQGKYGKAEELYKKSLEIYERELGENHLDTARSYNNLAQLYCIRGEYGKANELYKRSLEIYERELGENHLDTARSYNNLAQLYCIRGEYEKANELYKKSLVIYKRELGENHPDTALFYNNLATVYYFQGEYGKAEELNKKSLRISERELGENHPTTALIYNNIAQLYYSQEEYGKAEELYKKSLVIYERELGENHPTTALICNNIAQLYYSQEEYGKAEELFKKSLVIYERVLGENHPDTARVYNNLALVYYSQGEYGKAEELFKKSLRVYEREFGEDHPSTAMFYNNLAEIYLEKEEYEDAVSYFLKAYGTLKLKLGLNHPDTQAIYDNLEDAYSEWKPDGDFEQWLIDFYRQN